MENQYKISWVGIYRVFQVANMLIAHGGRLSRFEISTYKNLFEQLEADKKELIVEQFGVNLKFLNG